MLYKQHYLPHYWLTEGLKGTVVNSAFTSLHGGSLDITLTVPLREAKERSDKWKPQGGKRLRYI